MVNTALNSTVAIFRRDNDRFDSAEHVLNLCPKNILKLAFVGGLTPHQFNAVTRDQKRIDEAGYKLLRLVTSDSD